jgi:hypothetical protein
MIEALSPTKVYGGKAAVDGITFSEWIKFRSVRSAPAAVAAFSLRGRDA